MYLTVERCYQKLLGHHCQQYRYIGLFFFLFFLVRPNEDYALTALMSLVLS